MSSLSQELIGALPQGERRPAPTDALEEALHAAVKEAREAWPELPLEEGAFVRELAVRLSPLDPNEELCAAVQALRACDLHLSSSCARGEPLALALFDARFLSRVPALVSRVDRSQALADEVAQELRQKLLWSEGGRPPRIADYSGRGDLMAWLRIVAIRAALKLRRAQAQGGVSSALDAEGRMAALDARGRTAGAQLLAGADPERDYLRVRFRGEYERAFEAALRGLSPRERLFLKLQYVDGLGIDRIGAMYRLHRSTVARRLADHRRKLLEATRARLRETVELSDSEFDSVLAVVRSQLALNLRGALS